MQLTERPPNLLLQSGQTQSVNDVQLDLETGNHQLQELLLSGELDSTRDKAKHGVGIGSSISVILLRLNHIFNLSNITEIEDAFNLSNITEID